MSGGAITDEDGGRAWPLLVPVGLAGLLGALMRGGPDVPPVVTESPGIIAPPIPEVTAPPFAAAGPVPRLAILRRLVGIPEAAKPTAPRAVLGDESRRTTPERAIGLPKTATALPLIAIAGLGLLALGLWLRRAGSRPIPA